MSRQGVFIDIGTNFGMEAQIDQKSLSIDKQLMHKGDTCRFDLYDATKSLSFDSLAPVTVIDWTGNVLFNGLLAVDRVLTTDTSYNIHRISCQDATWYLNMTLANKKYANLGIDAIVRDLIATYVPFLTAAGVQSGLAGLPTFSAPHLRVSDALDKLVRLGSSDSFLMWDVSPDNDLKFFDSNHVPSSGVTLVDYPGDGSVTVGYNRDTFWYETDVTQIANTVTVRGGTFVSNPHLQTWVGDGQQSSFVLDYPPDTTPENGGSIPIVHVGGAAQAVALDNSTGFGSNQCLVSTAQQSQTASLLFATAPGSGVTITASYVYDVPIFIKLADLSSTGTLGTWESYVVDTRIVSQPAAARRAFGELGQFSKPIRRCEVHLQKDYIALTPPTRFSTLDVGQTIVLLNSQANINDEMIVAGYNLRGLGAGMFDIRMNLVSVG